MEDGDTVIYVNGEKFRQCKAVSIEIPIDNITTLENMKSIDELIERMSTLDAGPSYRLTPEEEFWGHCSSLEIWTENGYNSNLLHSSLAFPLLAKLSNIGDPKAKKVFKKEIIRAIESGFFPTIYRLIDSGYTFNFTLYDYEITFSTMKKKLNKSELKQILSAEAEMSGGGGYLGNYEYLELKYSHNLYELEVIKEIEHHIGRFLPYYDDLSLKGPFFSSENNLIDLLALDNIGMTYVPECVGKLKDLTNLRLGNNKLKKIPNSIGELENLSILGLYGNLLTSLPESIGKLRNLDVLLLSGNRFIEFSPVISSLKNLKLLRIRKNNLYQIPNTIKDLRELEILDLDNNKFTEIPSSVFNLQRLKELSLNNNLISDIPKEIINLKNLERLYLNNNRLNEIPQFLTKLKSLKALEIKENSITK